MPPERFHTGTGIFVDQDTFQSSPTDKDYTMGFQLAYSGWWPRHSWLVSRVWAGPLDLLDKIGMRALHERACSLADSASDQGIPCRYRESDGQHGIQSHTFEAGVATFTPRKGDPLEDGPDCLRHGCILASSKPVYDDRPYASLEFARLRRSSAIGKTAQSSELMWGFLGLHLSHAIQAFIHGVSGDVDPGGWKYQISNGIEPTANYRVAVKRLVIAGLRHPDPAYAPDWAIADPNDSRDDRWFDLTADVGASALMYTNLTAGGRIRLGWIDSDYWSSDREPLTFTRRGGDTGSDAHELYFFLSGGGALWGYNALLQGQMRHSAVTLPNHDTRLNHKVWDYEGGITARCGRIGLSYQKTMYTPLFHGPHQRHHSWGGFYLSMSAK